MAEWLPRKRPLAAASKNEKQPDKEAALNSLTPHLQWTRMTSCHVKKRKTNNTNYNVATPSATGGSRESEGKLLRVMGKAVFFLHDANSDLRNDDDNNDQIDDDNNLTWFQGRFFPSTMGQTSPTSVTSTSTTQKSWGLLGVQKHVQDECLRCSEGGYRELDLTVIRHITGIGGRRKAVRWKAEDLTWTGGDMMRLSSDYALRDSETGVKFEPNTLIDGPKALEVGKKYFPTLVKQITDDDSEELETLVVIGSIEMVLPEEFVRKGGALQTSTDRDEDDGLWSD